MAALLALGSSAAMAEEGCFTVDEVTARIAEQWPEARYDIFMAQSAAAITDGLLSAGANLSDGQRLFIVVERPMFRTVRLIGFLDGCFEDHVDLERDMVMKWLEGTPG